MRQPSPVVLWSRKRNTRFFPFGVGSSVNRYLMDRMADVGRGHAAYMLLDEDPAKQVEEFYDRFADPVLTHIEVDWADLDVKATTPTAVPDVFAGQPIWIVGRSIVPMIRSLPEGPSSAQPPRQSNQIHPT